MCTHKLKIQNISDGFFYSVAWVMPLRLDLGVLRGQNQIPSCCLSVMLSPPKPLDEIQLNLVCELLLEFGRATAFFCPAPWGPGEVSKGQISFNFNYKVNIKEFIPNIVCVLINERYKTYRTGFLLCCLGHAPGVGQFFFQTWSCGISNRRG